MTSDCRIWYYDSPLQQLLPQHHPYQAAIVMDSSSDLRTSFLKSKLSQIPHLPSYAPNSRQAKAASECLARAQLEGMENNDDGNDEDENEATGNPSNSKSKRISEPDYSPLSSEDCFEQALEIDVQYPLPSTDSSNPNLENKATFRVYYTPPKPKPSSKTSRNSTPFPSPFTSAPFNPSSASTPSTSTSAIQTPKPQDETLASLSLPLQSHNQDEDGGDGDDLDQNHDSHLEGDGEKRQSPGTVFVLHHGAGYSALSYALCAKEISKMTDGEAGVLAFDCRGHGRTFHPPHCNPPPNDFSLQTLTLDLFLVLKTLFSSSKALPSLLLVGHSMGGSICSEFCLINSLLSSKDPSSLSIDSSPKEISQFPRDFTPKVSGLAVLDVVEGTAMSALPGMKSIVLSRPKGFDSIEDAIKWHLENGEIRNENSARRSVASLIRKRTREDDEIDDREEEEKVSNRSGQVGNALLEEEEEEGEEEEEEEEESIEELKDDSTSMPPPSTSTQRPNTRTKIKRHAFLWRADLLATSPFWSEWFMGLSNKFLQAKTARLLLLAGTDRLDKELMIGQMQGKYQLVVFQEVGHSLQEDAPGRTARTLVDFWRRNESVVVVPSALKKQYGIQSEKVHLKRVGEQ